MSRALLACAVLALAGCAPQSLGGSLGQAVSLDFDRIELQVDADALKLSYLRETPSSPDVVFELVVLRAGDELQLPVALDLAARLEGGQPRAWASRIEANDTVLFPPITSGTLTIEREKLTKDRIAGAFGLHFASDASVRHTGLGMTVHGEFGGQLESELAP